MPKYSYTCGICGSNRQFKVNTKQQAEKRLAKLGWRSRVSMGGSVGYICKKCYEQRSRPDS